MQIVSSYGVEIKKKNRPDNSAWERIQRQEAASLGE